MNLDGKNYYEVLEISPNSTQEEIQNSYTRAKNSYSGDSVAMYSLLTQDECENMINLIEEAFSILSIPEKRQEYDKVRGIGQAVVNDPMEMTMTTASTDGNFEQDKQVANPVIAPREMTNDLMSETLNFDRNDLSYQDDQLRRDIQQQSSNFTKQSEHSRKSDIDVAKVTAFKKFSLDFQVNEEFEQEIENTTDYTGPFLKKIREYKNVTVERLADMTKISKTYIRALEDEDFEKLPALVYTRGFIFQYAKTLKLNPELVANSFLHHIKSSGKTK